MYAFKREKEGEGRVGRVKAGVGGEKKGEREKREHDDASKSLSSIYLVFGFDDMCLKHVRGIMNAC